MATALRSKPLRPHEKALAAVLIATIATAIAMAAAALPLSHHALRAIDAALYDSFYRLRKTESRLDGPVVIIAVDQSSIDRMAAAANAFRWPWPREYWGAVLEYLQRSGARVVAIDLLFEEPSGYNRETDDDRVFATALDRLTIPVVHAAQLSKPGEPDRFAPPVTRPPQLGAVDVIDDAVVRIYLPFVNNRPSLAVQTARAAGKTIPDWAENPFLLHFYGPTRRANGMQTYRYVPAYDVLLAIQGAGGAISPDMFRDKIVLIGATAAATFDLKSSPFSGIYPSVEAQATAIDNLLLNQRVTPFNGRLAWLIAWLGALIAAAGAIAPRRIIAKLCASLAGAGMVFFIGYVLFSMRPNITWLPLSAPLLGAILATVAGLSWTYYAETRHRRALLRVLAQYVSPHVAEELARRGEISLGGQRREMTVMFTDLAGFTSITENMPADRLEYFMGVYLSEMSSVLFNFDATVDKYIGDSIMSFWSAPLDQPDHAALACRAALRMCRREAEMKDQFASLGVPGLRTRIGLNTGPMVVGNVGSEHKVNYTVLGDAVNLASRLEGANKIYGSQTIVSESTVEKVRSQFLFRKLDLLRVRGRSKPLEVYELLAEGSGDDRQQRLVRQYEAAFSELQARQWMSAERILVELAAEFPDDAPTRALLARVRAFQQNPPAADWDGARDG